MKAPRNHGREWEDLFHRVLDGGGTASEIEQLHRLLAQSPEAMDDWIRLTHLHSELASGGFLECLGDVVRVDRLSLGAAAEPEAGGLNPLNAPRRRQLGWIAAALVAGLFLGGFGNSALRAVTERRLGKVATLLDESFESGGAPLTTGPSEQTGRWSGDFNELAGAQQGVRPRSGQRMLRFLSAAFEGKDAGLDSYMADAYRLLDLRPFAKELASGDLSLRFTVHVNARAESEQEPYSAGVYLYAVSQETILKGLLKGVAQRLVQESLSVSACNTPVDRDPATWQRVMVELRLPPKTEFVWVQASIIHPSRHAREDPNAFGGHFIDDVEAVLMRRDAIP